MAQLEHIEEIEKRLWGAADTLRANSNYASNEYFMPVMGLVFLRHAYSRYLNAKTEIEATLPKRGGKTRELTKEDFSQKTAIFLPPHAQFDYLVGLTDGDSRAEALIKAMESIEEDYENLRGQLPKNEYNTLPNDVLGYLISAFNLDELKQVSGDVFGRIYEYFLTQFADQKAHDGGEFFTPISLVSLIARILDPTNGSVLDPACGSGGMFVQSARVVERHNQNPSEKLRFYGLEKNPTTIRLGKMNLAVHGLEGDIQTAISYYDPPHHELVGKTDYVMANPPFNVDEIDAEKIKNDPRLPFGLPGVNKNNKVSNGNYIWISYFYSYLSQRGKAGFVMSSQASSAGRDEAKVRQKLIETGAVDLMVSIRSNFFYTRTVPCELWFLNRDKPEAHKDKVLMIDARQIYHQVSRKIYDFSPEQEQNILAIVWLYRGEKENYRALLNQYRSQTIEAAQHSFEMPDALELSTEQQRPLDNFLSKFNTLHDEITPFLTPDHQEINELNEELTRSFSDFESEIQTFQTTLDEYKKGGKKSKSPPKNGPFKADELLSLAEISRGLVRQADFLYRLLGRIIDACDQDEKISKKSDWSSRRLRSALKTVDGAREKAVDQLKLVRYYYRQIHWLTDRFPDGQLQDVEGLVKLVDWKELEANDWSLTPGRYVGVAPEEVDEDFDFEETMREIHTELEGLNAEAVELAETIKKNFEGLGI